MQRIHGLLVACTLPLPGISTARDGPPDVTLSFPRALPPVNDDAIVLYESAMRLPDDDGATVLITRHPRGPTTFRYSDGTRADVHDAGGLARIDAVIPPGQTLEDFAAYFYGPILGFVLRTRGTLALHASSVRMGEGALLFAGPTGAGKSTLAAALSTRGHAVLSDDLTAVTPKDGKYLAHPAFDHVRLWPSSEVLLFDRANALERITPTWDKRRFPLPAERFADAPRAVQAVFVLADDESTGDTAGTYALAPADALILLTTLTYANYLLTMEQRATELALLGELVRSVRVSRLVNRGVTMDRLCDMVERDVFDR